VKPNKESLKNGLEIQPILLYLCRGQMKQVKGTRSFPSLFFKMDIRTQEQQVRELVTAVLNGNTNYFLVDIKLRPGNNIRITLDADTGVAIDKCVEYNRSLYKKIEEAGIFPPGDFSLEVSSPGTDEPLRLHRQYLKNLGRKVEVTMLDGSRKEGKLVEVSEDGIIIEESVGQKKKKEVVMHTLLFDNIKSTKIQVVF
jgi:ribosome maturation factor RimP